MLISAASSQLALRRIRGEPQSNTALARRDTNYVIDTIVECIKELLPEGGAADLEGIGFAVPGNVDPLEGNSHLPSPGGRWT